MGTENDPIATTMICFLTPIILAAMSKAGGIILRLLSVAQDRQANGCLHTNSFAGCKNMEHEVRNVRVRNRVGVSLLDYIINCIIHSAYRLC